MTPAGPNTLQAGDEFFVRIRTTSSDNSTFNQNSDASVVFGGVNFATAPTNIAVTPSSQNQYPVVTWSPPSQAGDTAITGWQITLTSGSETISSVEVLDPTRNSYNLGKFNTLNAGQNYSVLIAAINGADGTSPNQGVANFVSAVTTTNGNASGTDGATQGAATAPNAPNTGFRLSLSNPIAIVGMGAITAAVLFVMAKRLARR